MSGAASKTPEQKLTEIRAELRRRILDAENANKHDYEVILKLQVRCEERRSAASDLRDMLTLVDGDA